jgi:hypothetical protein
LKIIDTSHCAFMNHVREHHCIYIFHSFTPKRVEEKDQPHQTYNCTIHIEGIIIYYSKESHE